MARLSGRFMGWAHAGRHALWCSGLASILVTSTGVVDRARAGSPDPVSVNRTVPKANPPKVLSFSSPPTDAEFLRTGSFAEPLAPVAATTPEENRALAQSLLAYRDAVKSSGASDAVEPLLAFLAAYPASAWTPALQLNLGMIYRQTGHFSKALDVWQRGWRDAQALSDPHGRALANAIVARLSQLEAYLGRKELLEPLLDSIHGRPVGGTAAQLITDSHEGLYDMVYRPEESFRCGPLALTRILTFGNATPSPLALQVLGNAHSTPNGLSLNAVQQIAVQAGMDYQMAYRTPGAAVLIPAVAHWKVGHYAAIVDRSNGRYLVQDTTFGEDIRVSDATLDEESSGYFLVPAGPLPKGWRSVSADEAAKVWGRGNTGKNHDNNGTGSGAGGGGSAAGGPGAAGSPGDGGPPAGDGGPGPGVAGIGGPGATVGGGPSDSVTPGAGGPCNCGGATIATVELEVVGLQLDDTPVGYTPPVGPPVKFHLVYSHRDMQQPATFSYTNFGPKWTFNWLSYVTDCVSSDSPPDCSTLSVGAQTAVVYLPGGGNEPFYFTGTTCSSTPPYTQTAYGPYSQATLTRTCNSSNETQSFTLTFVDGSSEQFNEVMGNQFFMTDVSDRAGNTDMVAYNANMTISSITDAIGQVTNIAYSLTNCPGDSGSFSGADLMVTQITDPFGRSANFTYSYNSVSMTCQLASITDVLGITSSYSYGQGSANTLEEDFINSLTTPYGTTTFTYGDAGTQMSLGSTRFLKTVDPLGRTSYVEYAQYGFGLNPNTNFPSDVNPSGGTNGHGALINPNLLPSGMVTCNNDLDYRNTFVFDANQYALATQSGSLNYSLGKVIHWLHTNDPPGVAAASRVEESEKQPLENRVWYYYPGQPDCLHFGVSSMGVVSSDANNRPSAIGRVLDNGTTQLQTFNYNSTGNVTQATDPVGRQLTYNYAANGIDLQSIYNTTNGGSQLLDTRTYNGQHLPLTITGTNGFTAHYQYNAFGEPTRYTDPQGHATEMTYDASGHLKTLQGPVVGATYSYAYDNVSRLAAVTDPTGSTLHFTYDPADRLVNTRYPDGTITHLGYTLLDLTTSTDRLHQTTRYNYDADRELISTRNPLGNTVQQGYNLAGMVDSITDARNHTTTWVLDDQSRVTTKQYANGTSASITYDSSLNLVAMTTDALSQTTAYTYNPDNTTATINYGANQPTASVSFAYDPAYLRVLSMTDGIGTTTYSYYPVSLSPALGANRLQSVTSPIAGESGSDTIVYSYDPLNRVVGTTVNGAAQSVRFDALGRLISANNPLDAFTYKYNNATPRVHEVSSNAGPTTDMTYYGPQGDELLNQMNITTHSGGTSLSQFAYTYNSDDNVTSVTVSAPSAQSTTYAYDAANRLLSGLYSGSTPQYAYSYDPAANLTSITTPNASQQEQTSSYIYTSTNAITAGTYDANGSPTALGANTYTWDGANRIVSFANAGNNTSSTFTYDGLGRLVRVVDSQSGSVIQDHAYTWCGSMPCLAHDNTGSGTSAQYFAQGMIVTVSGTPTPYYYVQDRLGSVTQLVTNTGSVATQYTYDPYGNRTTVSGTVVADIGYAGYFAHAASGLDFTAHRAYDPIHARWLNRDPIGEVGGVNLYAYVGGNPVTEEDPLGLCPFWDDISANAAQGISIQQLVDFLTTPSAWGISGEISTINPLTSGGGGSYGLNVEYTASEGWQLYGFWTPGNSNSAGLLPGWSLTGNIAAGTGPWTGPFNNVGGSLGPLSVGGFQSVDTGGPVDLNNIGYFGESVGFGGGPSPVGFGSSVTNYDYLYNLIK